MASKSFPKSPGIFGCFSSPEEYFAYKNRNIAFDLKLPPAVPTFQVSLYPSGELSASYFLAGSHRRVSPPPRPITVTTERLTTKSVQKIRRATENSVSDWKSFITLTFDPRRSQPDERGYVNQAWAKGQLCRFRKALTMKINRQIDAKLRQHPEFNADEYRSDNAFRYIWVAELQENGNIHFHFMFNKYFSAHYLRQLWGQGEAAVDCRQIKNASHAAAYICKYITKESDGRQKKDSTIAGNRYNISRKLREDSMPTKLFKHEEEAIQGKKLLGLMREMVEKRGGRVIDSGFGMVIPRPCHPVQYKDKKTGTFKTRRGVDFRLATAFTDEMFGTVPF